MSNSPDAAPEPSAQLKKYWLFGLGILGGLVLPIAATLVQISAQGYSNNLRGFIQAQTHHQILWVIDLSSLLFILIMVGGIIRQAALEQRNEALQSQLALRISELYNLKEISQHEIRVRQRAEARITRAKREWEATFDAISDLIILIDPDGKIVRCNQATIIKLDTSFQDLIGKPIEEVFPGVAEPIQKRVINKTQVIPMPSQFGWFEVTGFPFLLSTEQQGTIYIFHDINQRKRDEAEIQRQKQYFEAIYQNSPVAIVTLDLKGSVVTCNPAFERLFGYSPVEAAGRKLDDLITPPELRDTTQEYTRRIRRREVIHRVSQRMTRRGERIEAEIYTVPVVVNNEQLGTLVILYNITELVLARRKAEQADLAKSEYLANISHEIRTPLNGLIGMLNMTMETDLSVTQAEYLRTASDQAEALLGLLNDVLDLSKIEARKMELEHTNFDLRKLMENVALSMSQRAHDKDLELVSSIPPAVPTALRGDPNRLRQVLTNLLGNAVKFTETGEVLLAVHIMEMDGSKARLIFTVQDTGIGIPASRQLAIFDRFSQAADSTSRQYGGTGLGLAISSQLVELMGGKISLKSEPEVGSTFSFDAVFEKVGENEPVSQDLKRRAKDLRVIVADPNSSSRSNLIMLLENLGCRSVGTDNKDGLFTKLGKAEADGKPVQMVILDNHLVKDSTLQIVIDLRKDTRYAHTRIVLLARPGETSEARYRELGINAVLLKPVRWQPLQLILLDLLLPPKKRTGQLPALPPDRHTSKAMQTANPQDVLLAEDNPVNRKVVINLLEKFGHSVIAVENGQKVLEALVSRGYNLILMDVQMPELDGHEATQRIRSLEGVNHHTPIIAMTAHTFTSEIQRCFSSGMDAYLSKPLRPQELFDAVEQWSLPFPKNRPWIEQAARPIIFTPPPQDEKIEPETSGVEITDMDFAEFSSEFDELVLSTKENSSNPLETASISSDEWIARATAKPITYDMGDPRYLENILPRFGNDINFFVLTFEEFVQQSRSHLDGIRTASQKGDATAVKLLAHNLKGVAANFDAVNLARLAQEIDQQAGQGNLSQTADLVTAIANEIPELEKHLRSIRSHH